MIHLTLNGENIALSKEQAAELHNALSDELEKAGVDARQYRTLETGSHIQTFAHDKSQTDC